MCHECDLGIIESTKHLVMQCPVNEKAKEMMYKDIHFIDNEFDDRVLEVPGLVFIGCLENKYQTWMRKKWYKSGLSLHSTFQKCRGADQNPET